MQPDSHWSKQKLMMTLWHYDMISSCKTHLSILTVHLFSYLYYIAEEFWQKCMSTCIHHKTKTNKQTNRKVKDAVSLFIKQKLSLAQFDVTPVLEKLFAHAFLLKIISTYWPNVHGSWACTHNLSFIYGFNHRFVFYSSSIPCAVLVYSNITVLYFCVCCKLNPPLLEYKPLYRWNGM